MIRPSKSSLSRRPFVSSPGVRASLGRAYGRKADVRWSRALHGPLKGAAGPAGSRPKPRGGAALPAAAKKAASFLSRHARPLGLRELAQLTFVRDWRSRSGTHVRFQQMYRGVPIIGALLDVHLDPGGAVCMVCGAFHRRPRLSRAPGPRSEITKKKALYLALADLGRGSVMRARVKMDRLIQPDAQGYRLVYKVVLPAARPLGNWVYLIDPRSGAILYSYNTMRFARGKGRVYLSNPLEDPSLQVKPLLRLEAPSRLRGRFVEAINEDYPEALSESGSYLFPPGDTHFDEVMAYYHVDRVGGFFSRENPSLGDLMGPDPRVRVHVHAGDAMDNAYYDPSTGALYFGDGGGSARLNDLAKEAAVIYHEYTHAILDHVNPHLKGSEADALHEGYADYFACSLTDDAQIGEWVMASRGEPHLRDLTNRKRYPGDIEGEAHADGEIWSGACWDLRRALGRKGADCLVAESMHFLPEFARFSDAAIGVVQSDENVNSGRNAAAIGKILSARGLALKK